MKNLLKYQKMIIIQQEIYYIIYFIKLIGILLSRQTNTSITQHINFTKKLAEGDGTIMLLLLKNSKKLF